jgi:hypothetical protein
MAGIFGSDPFELLAYQQGQTGAPLVAGAAAGADNLDSQQRALTIGEPVPVVFCRRVGQVGGVLISPGAAEARFENDAANAVTASYRLVLSEGELDGIPVRDVFQRSCRVGSHSQAYNRAAGSWLPGNYIVERAGFDKPECPYYCGTSGTYQGLTTASFQVTVPDGFDYWNRQVHFFIRGGMRVTRLLDSIEGPSNNVADLLLWLTRKTSRVPAALIDVPAFLLAAQFTDAMGFRFDGILQESSNLEDFIANHARHFLLTKSKRGGKLGLRPLLPVDDDHRISTEPVTPAWVFDESRIIPGSFEIAWVPLAERKPFCILAMWRQQPDNDIGLVRTTEVRYVGTALSGPSEQQDMSAFCTAEQHAVRASAYNLARRRHITHTLRIKSRPAQFNPTLSKGDIVQVQMDRIASSAAAGRHSYYYEVDRIGKSRNGEVSLDLTHFPVDAEGRSLVALDVMAAVAGGVLLPTGRAPATITCDANSPTDPSVPPDPGPPPFPDSDPPGPGDPGGPSDPGGPDGPGAPGLPPLPDQPPYNPLPPDAPELPGGGIGGGGGGGGGEEMPPEPGDEPGDDPLDPQDPIPLGWPPPGIPPGGGLSPPFLDLLNRKIESQPPGVPLEFDWSKWEISRWQVVVGIYGPQYGIWDIAGETASGGGSAGGYTEETYTTTADESSSIGDGYFDGTRIYGGYLQLNLTTIPYTGAPGPAVISGYCPPWPWFPNPDGSNNRDNCLSGSGQPPTGPLEFQRIRIISATRLT